MLSSGANQSLPAQPQAPPLNDDRPQWGRGIRHLGTKGNSYKTKKQGVMEAIGGNLTDSRSQDFKASRATE